jgi:hypothetical protein
MASALERSEEASTYVAGGAGEEDEGRSGLDTATAGHAIIYTAGAGGFRGFADR